MSKLYLEFANPVYISNGAIKDRIDIRFNDSLSFRSVMFPDQNVPFNFTMQSDLPR